MLRLMVFNKTHSLVLFYTFLQIAVSSSIFHIPSNELGLLLGLTEFNKGDLRLHYMNVNPEQKSCEGNGYANKWNSFVFNATASLWTSNPKKFLNAKDLDMDVLEDASIYHSDQLSLIDVSGYSGALPLVTKATFNIGEDADLTILNGIQIFGTPSTFYEAPNNTLMAFKAYSVENGCALMYLNVEYKDINNKPLFNSETALITSVANTQCTKFYTAYCTNNNCLLLLNFSPKYPSTSQNTSVHNGLHYFITKLKKAETEKPAYIFDIPKDAENNPLAWIKPDYGSVITRYYVSNFQGSLVGIGYGKYSSKCKKVVTSLRKVNIHGNYITQFPFLDNIKRVSITEPKDLPKQLKQEKVALNNCYGILQDLPNTKSKNSFFLLKYKFESSDGLPFEGNYKLTLRYKNDTEKSISFNFNENMKPNVPKIQDYIGYTVNISKLTSLNNENAVVNGQVYQGLSNFKGTLDILVDYGIIEFFVEDGVTAHTEMYNTEANLFDEICIEVFGKKSVSMSKAQFITYTTDDNARDIEKNNIIDKYDSTVTGYTLSSFPNFLELSLSIIIIYSYIFFSSYF